MAIRACPKLQLAQLLTTFPKLERISIFDRVDGSNTCRHSVDGKMGFMAEQHVLFALAVLPCACSGRVLIFESEVLESGGAGGTGNASGAGGLGIDHLGGAANTGGGYNLGGANTGGANTGGAYSGGAGNSGGSTAVDGGNACIAGDWVLSGQVVNARDLGGVALNNGGTSVCGRLYRGGPLTQVAVDDCAAFDRLGVRTVIDLRTDAERLASPNALCVQQQALLVNAPMPVPYSVSPADYIADLNTYASVAAAFDVLGDEMAYPIYFHCTYGRDRTGVLAAVILSAVGVTRDDILTEYQLSAISGVGAFPESLNAVLDNIEQRGGIEAYLAQAGVSSEKIAILRSQVIAR